MPFFPRLFTALAIGLAFMCFMYLYALANELEYVATLGGFEPDDSGRTAGVGFSTLTFLLGVLIEYLWRILRACIAPLPAQVLVLMLPPLALITFALLLFTDEVNMIGVFVLSAALCGYTLFALTPTD